MKIDTEKEWKIIDTNYGVIFQYSEGQLFVLWSTGQGGRTSAIIILIGVDQDLYTEQWESLTDKFYKTINFRTTKLLKNVGWSDLSVVSIITDEIVKRTKEPL